jgi:hypothetical protein
MFYGILCIVVGLVMFGPLAPLVRALGEKSNYFGTPSIRGPSIVERWWPSFFLLAWRFVAVIIVIGGIIIAVKAS